MKVIIFIGHHKVGSTALQRFLAQNAIALLRSGILYPGVDYEGYAITMGKLLTGTDGNDGCIPINAREPHNALAFRMLADDLGWQIPPWHKGLPSTDQMLTSIRHQIDHLNPDVLIMASEVFSHFSAKDPIALDRLVNLFNGHEVRILATLRRVDDYLVSWHGQRLIFGHQAAPLRENAIQNYIKDIHFDYKSMLVQWISKMPHAEIILRNYSDVLMSGGACEDFMKQSGINFPSGLRPVGRENAGFHRACFEIARLGNNELEPSQVRELRRFLFSVQPQLALPQSNNIEMFGRENRELMANAFSPIHEYLSKTSGQTPFFKDFDQISKISEIDEIDAAGEALKQIHSIISDMPDSACLQKPCPGDLEDELKDFLIRAKDLI